jgi:hypothetical protein
MSDTRKALLALIAKDPRTAERLAEALYAAINGGLERRAAGFQRPSAMEPAGISHRASPLATERPEVLRRQ